MSSAGPSRASIAVFNDTRVDRHHGCERVMAAILALSEKNGLDVIATSPAHADWQRDEALLAQLQRARLVIVNGEGTIHHNRPAGMRLLEVGALARRMGVPAVLLNCGWEDNGESFLRRLGDFSLIAARDSRSATQIRTSGQACRIVPDLSLYGGAPAPTARSGIGFTDSVLKQPAVELEHARIKCGGRLMPIQFSSPGLVGGYRFIREYLGRDDLRHPFRGMQALALRMRQWRAQTRSTEVFMQRIAGLSLLVTGRFHACTLALVSGTPFVTAETNSHKIAALIEDVGLDRWRRETAFDASSLASALERGWSAHEAEAVAAYVHSARIAAEDLFREIRALT